MFNVQISILAGLIIRTWFRSVFHVGFNPEQESKTGLQAEGKSFFLLFLRFLSFLN